MPTENRSSNTEQMVSVPMGALEKCLRDANLVRFTCDKHVLLLQDLVSQPAAQHHAEVATAICRGCFTEQPKGVPCQTCAEVEAKRSAQHQGEPVGWTYEDGKEYTACQDHAHDLRAEGIELAPVYRHPPTSDGFSAGDIADQGAKAFAARDPEVEELRAKLAERENQCANLRATINAVRTVFEDNVDVVEYIDALTTASAEPSAPVERGPWQPITAPGQIKEGDWLSFTVAGGFICAQARLIINPGTPREEIVYNRQKNHYFVTSMAIDGTSTHKGVLVAKAQV
ncbi:hypothetical protein CQ065_07020 [Pseudomonas sp. MYb187]|uniref:hypothetical protein n=1 Tax=Pseudomonas TaxID=286 RepID=UPI000CFD5C4E|nr:hypothetical protein [Pseudomonas sp. MYb187]PRA69327.1 hypothetical protein CQ065_07020 [Pseudomonas sp. MYb187]